MNLTRRHFLKSSSGAAGTLGMGFTMDFKMISEDLKPSRAQTTFYVATDGKDAWSGKLAEPNTAKTDGPFATLYRARDAVRELKGKQAPTEAITVMVRGGKYYLEQTLVFHREDSGSQEFPVSYKAFTGETVVLSGGKKVTGWNLYKGQILQLALPNSKGGEWKFRQLFFNGEPQMRSRYPKYDANKSLYKDWLFSEGPAEKGSTTAFIYKPEAFPRRWAKPQNGEVMMFPGRGWADSILPIASIDEKTRTITAAHGARSIDFPPYFQHFDLLPGDRFRVENLLEELSEPGEWCLDSEDGILYFWPPNGGLNPTDEVVAPVLSTLVDLDGASWLGISGFTFTETLGGDDLHRLGVDGVGAMLPNPGWKYCGEALHLKNAEHCVIENNRFYAVGGNAIYLELYNARNIIRRNEISYAGANGVSLLGAHIPVGSASEAMKDGREQLPMLNTVTDNYIHHCGVFNKYIAGIFLGVSDSNLIAHNRLEYLPHHAINLGLNGYGRNLLEYNEIHFVCLELWDTAAINAWMDNPLSEERAGHVIRFNLITDVAGCHTDREGNILTPDGAANGIYLDANTSNCFIQGNIFVRSSGYAIYVHGGQHNFIENNIIVDSTANAAIRSAGHSGKVEYTGFRGQVGYYGNLRSAFLVGNRFCNNIVYYEKGRYPEPISLFDIRPRGDDSQSTGESSYVISESNNNVFFRRDNGEYLITEITQTVSGAYVSDVKKMLSLGEWQKQGFDLDSIHADPLFLDPTHDDYRLKPESPALRLGFTPIDTTKIGIRQRS